MKEQLQYLAVLQSGYQFRGRVEHQPAGTFGVLQIRDLEDGQTLTPSNLTRVNLDRSPDAYMVTSGDVIFLSRGQRMFAAAITQPLDNVIVPGYFFIIRPDQARILPAYVAWYINQPPAQNYLKQFHAGTHMPMVPISAVRELEVEVPPLEIQHAIAELAKLALHEQDLLQQIQQARQKLVQDACLQAISRTSSGRKQK